MLPVASWDLLHCRSALLTPHRRSFLQLLSSVSSRLSLSAESLSSSAGAREKERSAGPVLVPDQPHLQKCTGLQAWYGPMAAHYRNGGLPPWAAGGGGPGAVKAPLMSNDYNAGSGVTYPPTNSGPTQFGNVPPPSEQTKARYNPPPEVYSQGPSMVSTMPQSVYNAARQRCAPPLTAPGQYSPPMFPPPPEVYSQGPSMISMMPQHVYNAAQKRYAPPPTAPAQYSPPMSPPPVVQSPYSAVPAYKSPAKDPESASAQASGSHPAVYGWRFQCERPP